MIYSTEYFMGSYSTTCFASHQTIAERDKCRVIAIRQASGFNPVVMTQGDQIFERYGVANSTCHPDAFWEPASPFIEAAYYDYGQVHLAMTEATREALVGFYRELLTDAPVVAQGENPSHDVPFDLASFIQEKAEVLAVVVSSQKAQVPLDDKAFDEALIACWDYIWQVAEENRLFLLNYKGDPRPLQFAVIHEDAYQALVARTTAGTNWAGDSMAPTEVLQRILAKARKDAKEYRARLAAQRAEQGTEAAAKQQETDALLARFHFAERVRGSFDQLTQVGRHNVIANNLCFDTAMDFAEGKLTEEQCIAALRPLLTPLYAIAAMENLNIKFSPIEYAGQDHSNEIGQAYAAFVAEASKKVCRSRNVARFGEFVAYELDCTSQATLDALLQKHRGWDLAIEVAHREVREDRSMLRVRLNVTADLDYFGELLDEVADPLMRQSVRQVSA